MEERIDRLVNMDLNGRGIERLYAAARKAVGKPLALAAAEKLARVPQGGTVVITTGFASRGWISPNIAESDGPAGAAAVARALVLSRNVIPVVLAERTLLEPIGGVFRAAGMALVTMDEALRTAMPGGRLSAAVLREYPQDDEQGKAVAGPLLDELQPSLLFSVERVGRAADGRYYGARGADLGNVPARVDYVFDEAHRRGIPTVGVGDGGNEIGMGRITDAVCEHVRFGDRIGAITPTDVLMTACVSNWGCYAIVACLAALLRDSDLLHTPEREGALLRRGADLGLINSPKGHVDPNVDAIPISTHLAVVEILREMAIRRMAENDRE